MEWPNEVTLEFLALYERESSIWNPKDPSHKNRTSTTDAWKRIQNELSVRFSVQDLKKKKDSLMATFRPLASKVKRSVQTTAGGSSRAEDIFKPNWVFYEAMARFLDGVYQPKPINPDEDMDETSSYYLKEDDVDIGKNLAETTLSHFDAEPGSMGMLPYARKVGTKRKNADATEDCVTDAYKIVKHVSDDLQKDDCSLYTELLARKLRKFDEDTREILMHDIDELVYRVRFGAQD